MSRRALLAAMFAAIALQPGLAAAERYSAIVMEDGHQRAVGVVDLDARSRLSVISARPGRSALLRKIAGEVNAEDSMHVDAPPPPGSPPFANVTAIIPRGDPRFQAALRDHLKTYYALMLR